MFGKSISSMQQSINDNLTLILVVKLCWSLMLMLLHCFALKCIAGFSVIFTFCDIIEKNMLCDILLLLVPQTCANSPEHCRFFYIKPLLLIPVRCLLIRLECLYWFLFDVLDWTADILITRIGLAQGTISKQGTQPPQPMKLSFLLPLVANLKGQLKHLRTFFKVCFENSKHTSSEYFCFGDF